MPKSPGQQRMDDKIAKGEELTLEDFHLSPADRAFCSMEYYGGLTKQYPANEYYRRRYEEFRKEFERLSEGGDTMKKSDITCHRDGDVTYWSVYQQRWERCPATKIEDRELAAMSPEERERVEKHRRGYRGQE